MVCSYQGVIVEVFWPFCGQIMLKFNIWERSFSVLAGLDFFIAARMGGSGLQSAQLGVLKDLKDLKDPKDLKVLKDLTPPLPPPYKC